MASVLIRELRRNQLRRLLLSRHAHRRGGRRLGLEWLEERAVPATVFTVTNTRDSGAGSLRQAILGADTTAGISSIQFSIPGSGVQVIQLSTALPALTVSAVIDGTTQPGYSGSPLVAISGQGANSPAFDGLDITGGNSTVRGLIINNFGGNGIELSGGGNDLIAGNYIGTDTSGTSAVANLGENIYVTGGSSNDTIGGLTAADRNIISGGAHDGIYIGDSTITGTYVVGNYIGVNASGTGAVGNTSTGVIINGGATNTHVGGTASGAGNIISGNGLGIFIGGTTGAVIQGNYIGTNATGSAAVKNNTQGIRVPGNTSNDTIGGTGAGAANIISGNGQDGIAVFGSGVSNILIDGNIVGLDAAATSVLGNDSAGVNIYGGATNITVNGNIIAGNATDGVVISDSGTTANIVSANFIGMNSVGASGLGNGGSGVLLQNGTTNDTIGGATTAAGNQIANNHAGVSLTGSGTTGNAILRNGITGNTTLGIDLDAATGPNNAQSAPQTNTAWLDAAGNVLVSYYVNSSTTQAAYPLHVEFFAADTKGQGVTFVGFDNFTVSDFANGGKVVNLGSQFALDVSVGDQLVLTATDANGNTSEFSATITVTKTIVVTNTNDSGPGSLRQAIIDVDGDIGGTNSITFGMSGAQTINVSSPLPTLTQTFVLDATTEGGYAGSPLVVLNDTSPTGAPGLVVTASNSTIRGLDVENFSGAGIAVQGGASNVLIGGSTTAQGNVLANNSSGVQVRGGSTQGVTIEHNSIFGNNGLGIDLGSPSSGGPTFVQTAPTALYARLATNGDLVVRYSVPVVNGTPYVEFFLADANGQGKTFLGFGNFTADALGAQTINLGNAAALGVALGDQLVLTATDSDGNTSQFSTAAAVVDTIDVTNTNNSGDGSLRQAILDADANTVGTDTIAFKIAGNSSTRTITPLSSLPAITKPTFIDGTTQPGYAGAPIIQLNGAQAGVGSVGLDINATNSTVRGLDIVGFATGIELQNATNGLIENNYVGTDFNGTAALGNTVGVLVLNSSFNAIGGFAGANVISGNGTGIAFQGSKTTNNTVQGNLIGVGSDGFTAVGNTHDGIDLLTDGGFETIGDFPGNAIANNGGNGVRVGSQNNAILANSIYANGAAGIALVGTGNAQQAAPILFTSNGTTITGVLHSAPNNSYLLQFFASPTTGPARQGRSFVAEDTVTTDASGNASFSVFLDTEGPLTGVVFTATATDLVANNTSGFSAGPPANVVSVKGTGQSTTVNTPFATPLSFILTDAYGEVLPGIPVTFTAMTSGASGTFAGGVTKFDTVSDATGTVRAAFTANTIAGSDTVTATVAGLNPVTFALTNLPGAPQSLTVKNFPQTVAGAPQTFSVTAFDAFGNVATSYRGTVVFSSSDPQAVLPSAYTFTTTDKGVHTFSATLKTAGTQSLSVKDSANAFSATQNGIIVTPAAATLLTVSGYPAEATAGVVETVTVTAFDPFGNIDVNYRATVQFTSTDPQAVLPAPYTFTAADNGQHAFSITLKTAATQSITASDGKISGAETNIVVNIAPVHLVLTAQPSVDQGTPISLTVRAEDEFGNVTKVYNSTLAVTSSDSFALTAPLHITAGSQTFPNAIALELPGVQTITVQDTSLSNLIASTTVTVNNVPPSNFVLTPSATSLLEGNSLTLTGSFIDPGRGDTHTVVINWGDGTGNTTLALGPGVVTFQTVHIYNQGLPDGAPTLNAALQVMVSDAFASTQAAETIVVTDVPPVVSLPAILILHVGTAFDQTGSFTDPGIDNTFTAQVDYGDGSPVQALPLNPDHTFQLHHDYATEGSYSVTVSVHDNHQGIGGASILVNYVFAGVHVPQVSVAGTNGTGTATASTTGITGTLNTAPGKQSFILVSVVPTDVTKGLLDPATQKANQNISESFDVRAIGVSGTDYAIVTFSYSGTNPQIHFLDANGNLQTVKGSTDPARGMTFVVNAANHTITVVFDATSTPSITNLRGTVFTVTVTNQPQQLTLFQSEAAPVLVAQANTPANGTASDVSSNVAFGNNGGAASGSGEAANGGGRGSDSPSNPAGSINPFNLLPTPPPIPEQQSTAVLSPSQPNPIGPLDDQVDQTPPADNKSPNSTPRPQEAPPEDKEEPPTAVAPGVDGAPLVQIQQPLEQPAPVVVLSEQPARLDMVAACTGAPTALDLAFVAGVFLSPYVAGDAPGVRDEERDERAAVRP